MKGNKNALSKKRQDAKELIGILNKIPEERKGEVLCIVKGFCLCAESEADKKASDQGKGKDAEAN